MQPLVSVARAKAIAAAIPAADGGLEKRIGWALSQRTSPKTQERDHQAIGRDARSAALVVALNAAGRKATPPTRYLLVTGDRSLFNAGVRWGGDRDAEESDLLPFRMITQYIPVLRATQQDDDGAGPNRLRHAMDSFLQIGFRKHQRYPLFLPETSRRRNRASPGSLRRE